MYWQPIWNLLEGQFQVLLVNAQHIKAVPKHKTDVKDAQWIAELPQHGLLRPSCVPPRPQRQLRELTLYRTKLLAERAHVVTRLQKVLEGTNLKLSAVATNIVGVSARTTLTALLEGETNPQVLAGLARGKLRTKRAQLEEALVGQIQEQQGFVLTSQLAHLDCLAVQIASVTPPSSSSSCRPPVHNWPPTRVPRLPLPIRAISRRPAMPAASPVVSKPPHTDAPDPAPSPPLPCQQAVQLLDTLPGVNQRVAQIFLAEIGIEMGRFPSAAHLASWVGLCPGNHQSAGKQLHSTTRKGNRWRRKP